MKEYTVKSEIFGFENIKNVEIHQIDELFFTLKDVDNTKISFTMVNPYALREYSFDLPLDIKVLLQIDENSNLNVYNFVVIQEPLEDSAINFLSPIIVNEDNGLLAQFVLSSKKHPDFGMAERIKSFKE